MREYPKNGPAAPREFPLSIPLMVIAPVAVVVTLLGLKNVWITFLVYHLLICLIMPAVESLALKKQTIPQHFKISGLKADGPSRKSLQPGVRIGAGLGILMGGATVAGFWIWRDEFLGGADVEGILAGWGVEPGQIPVLLLVMVLGNGAAEELFWRGYIHRSLAERRPRAAAIGLTALAYASYHAVTVGYLIGKPAVVLLFTVVVFGAGCFWGWLRERYGHVWPALLSHTGATAGYMGAYWFLVANR